MLHRVLPRANSTCSALKGAEAAKKRCRKLPFRRGDVMQKFDRRRELVIRPNYPSNTINPRRDRETGERVHGLHTFASCMHNAGEEKRDVDSSSSRISFEPIISFKASIECHFFRRCGVLLAINFFSFFLFSSVSKCMYVYFYSTERLQISASQFFEIRIFNLRVSRDTRNRQLYC